MVSIFIQLKNLVFRYKIYFLLTLLFIPAVWDLLQPGYFSMHDDLQVFRLQQLDKCVKDFQLPCRWIPDGGFGYGYPMFAFYPPLPYYPAEILLLAGINLFWSIKIIFILSFILSGYFMYLLSKEFFGQWAGVVSAIFYVYAPYHSLDVYVRGAMNEAWGMVWFPLILLYAYKLIKSKKKDIKYIIFLSLSYSALLLSHNVMTLIFTPFLGLWALFWLLNTKKYKKIIPLALSGVWAVGLAAFFFVPVVLEQKFVHVESMTVGYFNYLAHFADAKQMFLSRFWGYGGSTWGPEDDMAFPIGQFHWVLAALASLIALLKIKKTPRLSLMLLLSVATGFIYAFLAHSRSVWFWNNLPLLYYAQFPWRLLTFPTFLFSFSVGYLIKSFAYKGLTRILSVVLIISVIVWNLPFFKVNIHTTTTRAEKLSGNLWELQVTGGIFDYLPKSAPKPPGDGAFVIPKFVTGSGAILNYKKGSDWMEFDVKISQAPATIMLPLFYYPGMKAMSDGRSVKIIPDPNLGRVQLAVDQDSKIKIKLYNTPIRNISNAISLTAIIALVWVIRKKHSPPESASKLIQSSQCQNPNP